jgi:hypothetical protein
MLESVNGNSTKVSESTKRIPAKYEWQLIASADPYYRICMCYVLYATLYNVSHITHCLFRFICCVILLLFHLFFSSRLLASCISSSRFLASCSSCRRHWKGPTSDAEGRIACAIRGGL